MTSPGDPVYVAAQIIQACEQGVHNPDTALKTHHLTAARAIIACLIPDPWNTHRPARNLAEHLDRHPTTQTLFTT